MKFQLGCCECHATERDEILYNTRASEVSQSDYVPGTRGYELQTTAREGDIFLGKMIAETPAPEQSTQPKVEMQTEAISMAIAAPNVVSRSPPNILAGDPWYEWESQDAPNCFGHVNLAQDGGLSEVKDLYDFGGAAYRWLAAGILIVCVIYNIWFVATMDIDFLVNPDDMAGNSVESMAKANKRFYLSFTIYNNIAKAINAISQKELVQMEFVEPVRAIGLLELVGLSFYCGRCLKCLSLIACGTGRRRWLAVANLFWNHFPKLSVYSALKLLDKVQPVRLSYNLGREFATAKDLRQNHAAGFMRAYSELISLLVQVALSFIVGFDVFLLKIRVVSNIVNQPSLSLSHFAAVMLFFVQMVGVVRVCEHTTDRLFVFIFGGEDGVMQRKEKELMRTWEALLARKIYRDYSFVRFLVVMMSFCDEDFQKLTLNEASCSRHSPQPKGQSTFSPRLLLSTLAR